MSDFDNALPEARSPRAGVHGYGLGGGIWVAMGLGLLSGCKSSVDEPAVLPYDAGTSANGFGGVETRPHHDAGMVGGGSGGQPAAGGVGGEAAAGGAGGVPAAPGSAGGDPAGGAGGTESPGGTGGTGGAGGAGGTTPPPEPAGRDEECDPLARSPCRRGLACYESQPPVCLPACDALDAVSCGEGRACFPAGDGCPDNASCEGACLSSHGCVPGDEAAACGGPASCFAYGGGSFCAPVGNAGAGQDCNYPANCRAGLACDNGRCAAPCTLDAEGVRTCAAGSCVSRVLQVGTPFDFCQVDCDWEQQLGCGLGEACIPVDSVVMEHQGFEGNVRENRVLYNCVHAAPGQATDREACVEDENYWGSCTPTHTCDDLGDGAICYRLCVDVCGDGVRMCTTNSDSPVGFCYGECQVTTGLRLDGAECGAGLVCAASGAGEAGFCVEAAQASAGLGEPCHENQETGLHNCGRGLFCPVGDAAPVCRRLCSRFTCCPDAEGNCPPQGIRGNSNCPIGGVPAGFDPDLESDGLGFCPL